MPKLLSMLLLILFSAGAANAMGVVSARPHPIDSIVAAGDSITAWVVGYDGTFVDDAAAYTPRIAWTNKGVSGNRTSDLLTRWNADVVALHPDAVVLMIGTNDVINSVATSTSISNITSMLASALTNHIHVYLCKVPPWKAYSTWSAAKQTLTDDLNTWIDTQASQHVTIIDTYSTMEDASLADYFITAYRLSDGLHPNNKGYHRMARIIAGTIDPDFETSRAYQILTTYTEVDPNNQMSVSQSTVTAAAGWQAGTASAYVGLTLPTPMTTAGSTLFFDAKADASGAVHRCFAALSDTYGTYIGNRDAGYDEVLIFHYSTSGWVVGETYNTSTNNSAYFADATVLTEFRRVELQLYNDGTRQEAIYTVYSGTDKESKSAILDTKELVLLNPSPSYNKLILSQHVGAAQAGAAHTVKAVALIQ